MTGRKHHGNTPAADPRQRVVSLLLALLFLASVLLTGLMPGLATAQDDVPIQLQALCHNGPDAGPGSDDAPADVLPCCVLCCSATHEGACAPPLAATRVVRPPLLPVALLRPALRSVAPHSHRGQPQPARGPPALI